MNHVKINLGGREHFLLFNGYAMFQIQERFETESKMLEQISARTAAGFDSLCDVLLLLMEQGELARRYEGHEPCKLPDKEELQVIISPLECVEMQKAVLKTILAGIGREVEEAEKDLGLAELEQKKTNP